MILIVTLIIETFVGGKMITLQIFIGWLIEVQHHYLILGHPLVWFLLVINLSLTIKLKFNKDVSGNGYYVYIKAVDKIRGQKGRLVSPLLNSTFSAQPSNLNQLKWLLFRLLIKFLYFFQDCLQFYYHLYGDDVILKFS